MVLILFGKIFLVPIRLVLTCCFMMVRPGFRCYFGVTVRAALQLRLLSSRNNDWRGWRITNVTGRGQRIIKSYYHYWDSRIIAIETVVSSLLRRLYHHYWDSRIITYGTSVPSPMARVCHNTRKDKRKLFFVLFPSSFWWKMTWNFMLMLILYVNKSRKSPFYPQLWNC